jgi:hypothetical protein
MVSAAGAGVVGWNFFCAGAEVVPLDLGGDRAFAQFCSTFATFLSRMLSFEVEKLRRLEYHVGGICSIYARSKDCRVGRLRSNDHCSRNRPASPIFIVYRGLCIGAAAL